MSLGSGQFSSQRAFRPHLTRGGGGLAGEVADLRDDVKRDFSANAAIAVEEFTNPPGVSRTAIRLAAASVASIRTISGAGLDGAIGVGALSPPRNITATVGGTTPSDAPATSTVTGLDADGAVITEQLTLPQAAGTVEGTKLFAKVTSIEEAAGDGTGATISYGIGKKLGLGKALKARAGRSGLLAAIAAGALYDAPITVEEWTDPVATAVDAIVLAAQPSGTPEVLSGAGLDGTIGAGVLSPPRNVTATTAGSTPTNAPATAVFVGLDINGVVIQETINVPQSVTTVVGVKAFAQILSISVSAADNAGADCTVSYGIGDLIGLSHKIKTRAGVTSLIKEHAAGAVATNGVVAAAATGVPNGTYAPNSGPNGSRSYAIWYERDDSGDAGAAGAGNAHGSFTPDLAPDGTRDYAVLYEYDAAQNT